MFQQSTNKKPKHLKYKCLGFFVVAQPGVEPGLFFAFPNLIQFNL